MLEEMVNFFEDRLDIYEKHQLECIEGATDFYNETARHLPLQRNAKVLDLGCGTGLELEEYFRINESAKITGIDLSPKMLKKLEEKFPDKEINLICDNFFNVDFEKEKYDAVVSVETFHHFTYQEKLVLYKKIYNALSDNGYLVITDYFAKNNEEESKNLKELRDTIALEHKEADKLYHFDIPQTLTHETDCIFKADFKQVSVVCNWGSTYLIVVKK